MDEGAEGLRPPTSPERKDQTLGMPTLSQRMLTSLDRWAGAYPQSYLAAASGQALLELPPT